MSKTKKEAAALLGISTTRVEQLMPMLLLGEEYWYVEVGKGQSICQFSDDAVERMRNRANGSGRPRKHPISDAPKRPRGRPRKEKAPA